MATAKQEEKNTLTASRQELATLKDLEKSSDIQKLNVSHNKLINMKGIRSFFSVTWLNLSYNMLVSIRGIEHLRNLVVLNASHNSLTSCDDIMKLTNLKALILNDNQLTKLPSLSMLVDLNTLILSNNLFESIDVTSLSNLTKLSLSFNKLATAPSTKGNSLLLELRLTGNNIAYIPQDIQYNKRLQILDLGQNSISCVDCLKSLTNLKNLNLKGNPITEYTDKIRRWLPRLHVLDGFKLGKLMREEAVAEIKLKPEEAAAITTKVTETRPAVNEAASDDSEMKKEAKPILAKKRKRGRSGVVSIENVKKKRKTTKDIFNIEENNLLSW
ncbi:PREDICTED: leucine-rich repeat-containing protein 40-like isoform X2 [Amphimedon queenslandica]|uniref:U2A'/phosphoprotein 32 family A C-terminal domain-containing protein n=1 Tax=Amphimedon queenslandica TaxID=400682 RepID=A0A1X7VT85_AMPQE|nr:PREDICTED: leucine-rich repeat-containing protein 40-like isoform X2 [Amphimedon queenslandica]|eukprot:XP_019852440.1 PREDICTED: leucine-rich repeat-containing protein 40-like isoform X2 [Amphimedon queenslandica]